MDFYSWVLMIAACLLMGLSNIRIGVLMAEKKWKLDPNEGVFTVIVSTIAAVIIGVFMSVWAQHFGGNFYQLGVVIIAIPVVGLTWAFVVGLIKTFERMLLGLCTKLG